jgi:hypothetical protein
VNARGTSLEVRTPDASGVHRQEWTITAGAEALSELDLKVNAGSATVALAGATLTDVRADMNAGDLLIDGSGAGIAGIDASVNAGRLRITLDQGDTSGQLSVNAGAIELCVPPDAELRFDVQDQFTFATNLGGQGLDQDGESWTRAGSGGPVITLDVEGNAASFTLDPEGGCK